MNLLILTSKDHIYANFLLKSLDLSDHEVLVLEQDSIIPGKWAIEGLLQYLRVSGLRYVVVQAAKQYLFRIARFMARLTGNRGSVFYPYYADKRIKRRTLNGINERIEYFKSLGPELVLSIYSKEILSQELLGVLGRVVNLHPSPLPLFRGVSPTFWSLAEGSIAGVTLHHMDSGVDTGAIISQKMMGYVRGVSEHQLYLECTKAGIGLVEQSRFVEDHFQPGRR